MILTDELKALLARPLSYGVHFGFEDGFCLVNVTPIIHDLQDSAMAMFEAMLAAAHGAAK